MSSEASPQFLTEECQSYCLRVADGTHESPKEVTVGKLLVTSKNIKEGRVVLDTAYRISETDFDEINKRSKVDQWDIILTMIGTVGELCLIDFQNPDFAIKNVGLLKCGDKYKAKWLYYFLKSPTGQALIEQRKKGSTQQYISLGEIRKLPISYPADPVQMRGITDILSTLDDRIALLRETNATLEAIAQALFKSWFVDFDPVHARAKAALSPCSPPTGERDLPPLPAGDAEGVQSCGWGEGQGLPEPLAALFPDSFEESPLGLVPRGWRVGPVGDAVECVGGGTPDTKNPAFWEPAEHPWTTPKDLSGLQSSVLLQTERKLSSEGLAKVSSGLLPAGTLLMSSRAPIGYLAIAQMPVAVNQGYIAMPPGGQLPPLYMLFWCRQNMDTIKSHANGSTFMEISKKAFRPLPALVPPAEIITEFQNIAEPLFARLVENEKQAQTLATLRDTLLPRLISGQLRLPEAEAMIEDVKV